MSGSMKNSWSINVILFKAIFLAGLYRREKFLKEENLNGISESKES